MGASSLAALTRRPSVLVIALVAVFLLSACGQGSTPAPSGGPNGVALVAGAAVSATIGPDGGELTASDPERGRSYRLTVPAGTFADDTEITVSPIAAIDGFPLDGGLLGGVELEPEEATFLVPVALEIRLDADGQAALRSAIDEGQAVVGFHYPGDAASAADELGVSPADVAADGSSVTLTLFSFSGHGAGTGNPQNLQGRPCHGDAAAVARCELAKIIHPPGGPADLEAPAVRAQLAAVLRVWLADGILPDLRGAADTAAYRAAIARATEWHAAASTFSFLGSIWYDPGDEFETEGRQLDQAVQAALGDWLTRVIVPQLGAVTADPSAFDAALTVALEWHRVASAYAYLTEIWFEEADPMAAEGMTLRNAVVAAYEAALAAANRDCQANGDVASVIRLIELDRIHNALLTDDPDDTFLERLFDPANFCVKVKISDITAPATLAEGDTAMVSFRLTSARDDLTILPPDWYALLATGVFRPTDPSAISVVSVEVGLACCRTSEIEVTVTAGTAVRGSTTEGTIKLGVKLLGLDPLYATDQVVIDVTPDAAAPITCSDDPTTVTYRGDERIAIVFDGTSCSLIPDLNDDDDPNVALVLDTDEGQAGWNAGSGSNWSREGVGDNEPPGRYSIVITRKATGERYTLTFTVEVTVLSGGDDVRLTVRDVTIAAAGADV